MCISTDESVRSNRKPLAANNEHDYSTWNINDTFDIDLSEYLIDDTKEEPTQHQLLPEPVIYQTPAVDETQNFDAPAVSKSARRYSCPVCSKLWVTPSKLKRHMSVHRNEKQTKEISKSVTIFSKVSSPETPKQIQETTPEVQCPICFLAIENQIKLQQHMTSVHIKTENPVDNIIKPLAPIAQKIGKNYICSLCQNVSLTPEKLQAHMRTKHTWKNSNIFPLTDEKWSRLPNHQHFCSFCSKSFHNALSLKRHVLSHQKPKKTVRRQRPRKYSCQYCGKRFETPSKIQRHQTVHRDILQSSKCESDLILEISAVTSILGD